jgi:hypothetical protein
MRIPDVSTTMLKALPVALAVAATVVTGGCADKSMSAMEQPTQKVEQSETESNEAVTNDGFEEIILEPPTGGGGGGDNPDDDDNNSGGGGGDGGDPGDDNDDDIDLVEPSF